MARRLLLLALVPLLGCNLRASRVNVDLRKQVQRLEAEVADLNRRRTIDQAQIRALQSGRVVTMLAPERLQNLFVTTGVAIRRPTIGVDYDTSSPGTEGIKVSFVPIDQDGFDFKAAGTAMIELFDLAAEQPRIGQWPVSLAELREAWINSPLVAAYVVERRWQTVPARPDLTVKVTFTDELTGAAFDAQKQITVDLVGTAATLPAR